MNDIKNSTLGERILLGIIAGLFAVVGFYIGYEHLSNGVNPIVIGSITAIVVMLGCMAAAFILEELIRKIPAAKKKNYEEIRKQHIFGSKKDSATTEEPEKAEAVKEEPTAEEVVPEQKPAFARRMTLLTPAEAVASTKEQEFPKKAETNIDKDVKNEEATVNEDAVSSSEWEDEEMIVKPKPVAPIRPVSPKAPEKEAEANTVAESQSESLSLVEFIKSHPEFSARKMVKEYRLAGGTEPTDNILNLMN